MIPGEKVLICTPSHNGHVVTGYAGGMASSPGLYGGLHFVNFNSHVGHARATIAHTFLRHQAFDWLVMIDSDIGFRRSDLELLLDDPEPAENQQWSRFETGEAVCVLAEYARKNDTLDPALFGLGFCRIHRAAFEELDKLQNEDGSARLAQFFLGGELVTEYFPSGACLGDGHWYGEDTAFWTMLKLAKIIPRIEQRTQLSHWGLKCYQYVTPVMGTSGDAVRLSDVAANEAGAQ